MIIKKCEYDNVYISLQHRGERPCDWEMVLLEAGKITSIFRCFFNFIEERNRE